MNVLHFIADGVSKIDPGDIGVKNPVKDANVALGTILNTVYTWAGIICVLVIIIGAFLYTTSAGDQAGVKRGKDAIIGACIGLVVVMMAFVITQYVLGRF